MLYYPILILIIFVRIIVLLIFPHTVLYIYVYELVCFHIYLDIVQQDLLSILPQLDPLVVLSISGK